MLPCYYPSSAHGFRSQGLREGDNQGRSWRCQVECAGRSRGAAARLFLRRPPPPPPRGVSVGGGSVRGRLCDYARVGERAAGVSTNINVYPLIM